MFRRSAKNSVEFKNNYHDEPSVPSHYQYGPKEHTDVPPRIFEHPRKMGAPRVTPLEEREEAWGHEKTTPLPHHFQGIPQNDSPETTLGEGVTFRGELSFERLLRIDGTFEGELLSQGKVVVGPKGKVKANLNLREAIIEGEVEGNIVVQEKLELRGAASIHGDITAKSICVDEGVTIKGTLTITPEKMSPETPKY